MPRVPGDYVQRYVVDLMLMRLGRWLRLLGQDVALPEGESDEELLRQAAEENRMVITRDKRLSQACPDAGVR
ncbi:MAG: Mut7-C RNAse domain-containing protein, partial [Methanothrix sp.]|nr:Mut7-C RNAse domain-containing protein [Methanothrix sp.]